MWKIENRYLDIAAYVLTGFLAALFTSYLLLVMAIKSATICYFLVWVCFFALLFNVILFLFFTLFGRYEEIYLRRKNQINIVKKYVLVQITAFNKKKNI